jgi:CXXX repeat peptide maturase
MKENLSIQFVFPDYQLPDAYMNAIESIDHTKIMSASAPMRNEADVIILDSLCGVNSMEFARKQSYVLKIGKHELLSSEDIVAFLIEKVTRLNIIITDIDTFTESDFLAYEQLLSVLSKKILSLYERRQFVQCNLLTDRIYLDAMNNCNAGVTNITLAPDGRFYVCPAFYYSACDNDFRLGDSKVSIGSLEAGISISNGVLYKLDHAPICRKCDAYQCKRCVWMNRKTTNEVNTPGREQCVVAYLERNASRSLLQKLKDLGICINIHEIEEISYLDPIVLVKLNF